MAVQPNYTQDSTQLTEDQKQKFIQFAKKAFAVLINQTSLRTAMEEIDRQYMREKNYTREQWEARISNWRGDASKIQDITIPIMMPQVESALGYMANVFATGMPLFPVNSAPEHEKAAKMMQAVICENAKTGRYRRELIKFFRDGLKYNIHALEVEWARKTVYKIEDDIGRPTGYNVKNTIWNGNIIKRVDMYNAIFDPRVHPADMHLDGEFAGYIDLFSRIKLKQYISDMVDQPTKADIHKAFTSSAVASAGSYNSPFGYYFPLINPFPMMNQAARGTFDWMAWVLEGTEEAMDGRFPGMYEVCKLYCRIIPDDFQISAPDSRTPQVWKLIIVNRDVLLYARRCTNVHNMLPMLFGQPIEDGLDTQTKSYAQNVGDFQAVGSALVNGYVATMRRNVSDRAIYNPMYISHKDLTSNDPSAKFAIKPAGFGKKLDEIYMPVPFHPENSQYMMNGVSQVMNWANLTNGQNPAQQGTFVKGNKTQDEFNNVMGHGNDRNQLMAIMEEDQVFTPLKEQIKLNILQFQQNGQVYDSGTKSLVSVDITTLRQAAVEFEVSDGLQPEDKIMSSDEWTTAVQAIGSSPDISSEYDRGPMFSYLMNIKNVDLSPFELTPEEKLFRQQLNTWQQVAIEYGKMGQEFKIPMPQPSPQLQAILKAKAENGGVLPGSDNSAAALAMTQGGNPQTAQRPQLPASNGSSPGSPAGGSGPTGQQSQGVRPNGSAANK